MKKLLAAILFSLFPLTVKGEPQAIPQFRGLHNSENSVLINDDEAQDLQDVDITDSGRGIKKRQGYDQYKTIGTSTWAVRGGHYFRDTSANDNIIHANNQSVFKSAAGGNYSAFITTDTAGSYYDFTDSQGNLWRANSNRDEIFSYNGSAVTYYPSHPKGDQIEVLPDRLVISGVSATPNRIHFSGAADFTTFATGIEESDPYTEDIGLPGQKINAIKVACGDSVLAWTRDTMSQYSGTNQFNGIINQVSNTIGTTQPNSVIQDYGITYWQAQDKHFYAYDCNVVTKISKKLDVSNFAGGETRQWEQTAQSDWQAGTLTNDLSATLSVGDISMSTWTDTDTSGADFGAGTLTQMTTSTVSGAVHLSTNNTNVQNNDFEDGSGTDPDNWTENFVERTNGLIGGFPVDISPQSGSYMIILDTMTAVQVTGSLTITILDNAGATLSGPTSQFQWNTIGSTWQQRSFSLSSWAGRNIKIKLASATGNGRFITSDTFFCSGGTFTYYVALQCTTGACTLYRGFVDLTEGGRSTIYDGNIVSQIFDTTISSPAWLSSNASWTSNGHNVSAQTQSSPDGSSFDSLVTWSTGSAPTSAHKRYIRYKISVSTATDGTALPYIDDVALSARSSTGTFVSQTKEIGSNATAFRNFSASDNIAGGTISYFIRTATTEGGLASASYTSLTKDAQISASINPWIQVKATFTITAATQEPTLSSFIVGWDEGTLVRSFGSVDKDHRLMWSLSEGASTVPNATYIYDQRFDSWVKYSVPFDAPARVGNSIYFGGVSTGVVYNWPSGEDDNGSAITAYWKSKDFVAPDPFVEKDFLNYSLLAKSQTGSNIDIAYTVNTSSEVSTNHSLTDPNSLSLRRINANMASGKFGTFINFKFGNNDADAPFELYGFKYEHRARPWRVLQ